MNLYGFAGGDPVNYSDPFGLWPDWIQIASASAGFGDALLFGAGPMLRRLAGADGSVNMQSGAYFGGAVVGAVALTAATAGAGTAARGAGLGAGLVEESGTVATSGLRATERVSRSAVNKLAGRIKADGGIKESLKYVEHNGEKWVVDGNHRLRAAQNLRIETVPAERVSLPYKGFTTIEDLFHGP